MLVTVVFDFDVDAMTATLCPETTANEAGVLEILESWIRMQLGAGPDVRIPNDLPIYHVAITVDLTEDRFTVKHDCGNDALATGVVLSALRVFTKTFAKCCGEECSCD